MEALAPTRKPEERGEEFERGLELLSAETFVEYLVHDSKTGETRRFVGEHPSRPVLSLQGRATRGAPVYDVNTGAVFYLKDVWRINSDKQPSEDEIYELLHKANVSNIAKVVAHGDVISSAGVHRASSYDNPKPTNYQVTQSNELCRTDEEWCTLKPRLQGYIHYRIVFDMVGHDYLSFRSTRELLSVTVDAMQ
jgi:hypothetical protein